jgi:phage RecT family recombinase
MATAARAESTAVVRTVENTNIALAITTSDAARQMIEPLLPKGVAIHQVAAQVRLALAKDKSGALKKCTAASVILAVAKIVGWGLEVGETAHLVPFGTECTPIADYKGIAELVIGAGVARAVEAHCVYEKEPFRLKRGTSTEIEHHPIADPSARGKMVGAYALFHLRFGITLVEYMAVSEIDAIRQKHSKQWKGGALEPWYARKTVVRRGVKLLPKNPRLLERLAAFDNEVVDIPEELAALAVQPA